jgi:hypothetical protein
LDHLIFGPVGTAAVERPSSLNTVERARVPPTEALIEQRTPKPPFAPVLVLSSN